MCPCSDHDLDSEGIDLWGPLLSSFERRFGAKRSGKAGRRQTVSDDYMTIVTCRVLRCFFLKLPRLDILTAQTLSSCIRAFSEINNK